MAIEKALMTSDKQDWETPNDFFEGLDDEFYFDTDVCASRANSKCSAWIDEDRDCLSIDWTDLRCFMNPPYREPEYACKPDCKKKICEKRGYHNDTYRPGIIDFMRKAYEQRDNAKVIVCLVPARTDTNWFHEYAARADEIRYIKGRIKFVGAKSSAPFPSALVIFKRKPKYKYA